MAACKPNGARIISKAQLDALFVRTKTNPPMAVSGGSTDGARPSMSAPPRRAAPASSSPPRPRDMIAAMGAQDRKLFIVPSMKLIVVRTGQAAPDRDFNEKLWQLLTKAMPQH